MSAIAIEPVYLGLPDAARYLGVSVKTVRRRIADGTLPAFTLGGRHSLRVKVADLDALLQPLPVAGGAR